KRDVETPISPVKQLAQHVIHGLAVLLLHRWRRGLRDGRRRGLLGLRRRCLRGVRRGHRRDAAARTVAGAAATPSAEEAAGRLAKPTKIAASAAAALVASEAAESPDNVVQSRAIGPEQALAHLTQLAIGGFGIVEDALNLRIDFRRRPWPRQHHG